MLSNIVSEEVYAVVKWPSQKLLESKNWFIKKNISTWILQKWFGDVLIHQQGQRHLNVLMN